MASALMLRLACISAGALVVLTGSYAAETTYPLGPAGLPKAVVAKLAAETQAAVASPAFVKRIEGIGLETAGSTPQELGDMIRSEMARWTKVIQSSGIKID